MKMRERRECSGRRCIRLNIRDGDGGEMKMFQCS